jgi:hypothetical protein
MRAQISERKVFSADVEHAHRSVLDVDDLRLPRLEVADRANLDQVFH